MARPRICCETLTTCYDAFAKTAQTTFVFEVDEQLPNIQTNAHLKANGVIGINVRNVVPNVAFGEVCADQRRKNGPRIGANNAEEALANQHGQVDALEHQIGSGVHIVVQISGSDGGTSAGVEQFGLDIKTEELHAGVEAEVHPEFRIGFDADVAQVGEIAVADIVRAEAAADAQLEELRLGGDGKNAEKKDQNEFFHGEIVIRYKVTKVTRFSFNFSVICSMRFVKSFLLLMYLLSSLPVLASYHYCLGRVKQISFYETAYADCVCPEPEAARDCCDDELQLLDFQDDHAGASTTLPSFQGWALLAAPAQVALIFSGEAAMLFPLAHAPPQSGNQPPLFVVHQSFLL